MLINFRNAMMAGKRLPYDVVPVEYIESHGTEWIDTGYKPNTNTRTVGQCRFNSFVGSTADYVFGVFSSPNNYGFNVGSARQHFNVPWGSDPAINIRVIPQTNKDYEFDISKTGYLIDGQSYVTVSVESVNSTINMYLFWSNGTRASGMDGRLYYTKIYDNGILVRDFIPVRKGNVGYLYDRVTRKLFGNAGTGDFVLGPDVVPVEYIESHGTEWIDTGVTSGPGNLEFTVDCTITNTIGTSETYWTGSGVNSVGGLHYVLEQRGIRAGGGSVANSIPYTSGERVQIRTYYDEQNRRNVQIGDRYYYGSAYSAPTANLCLLRMVNLANQKGFFFSATVSQSGALVRKFLPVRVGTEGALIDTLTRRIYRNAGTGAFTYGNDLKYPIQAE